MSVERRAEVGVRCLVLAPGLVLAPFVLPTSVIIVLLVSSGLVVGLTVSLMRHGGRDDERGQPRRQHYSAALRPAGATSLAVVSLAAVTTISATLALLLLPVLLVCSPKARDEMQARWLRVFRAGAPEQPEVRVPAQARSRVVARALIEPQQLTSLTSRELCLAWRASFVVLQHAPSTSDRNAVVAWRHACLDEFESRYPEALAAWLGSGARAASGPDRFLPPGPDRAA